MIERYLATRYVKGARGPEEFDCYGLVRDARRAMFERDEIPACEGVAPSDKRKLTQCCHDVVAMCSLVEVTARPGAIATAWRGSLCVHVGLVVKIDGRLRVLETDEPTGPCLTSLQRFAARYRKVIFYDN